jgi:hypothetical protein
LSKIGHLGTIPLFTLKNTSWKREILSYFYFPHMKYGKYWFHLQFFFFFIANFHVLGLFMPKKRVKSEKKISVCHVCGFLDEIWGAASSAVLNVRKLKFWLPASFEPTWCTSYSEFWNSFKKLRSQKI